MKSNVMLGAIGLGVVLLMLSGLWGTLFPATSNWTPEKERRWQTVKARIHTLSFHVGATSPANLPRGMTPTTIKNEFEALQKENAQLQEDYTSAADGPKVVAGILRWTGIGIAAVGIVGWMGVRGS
jgi:hypothetical protein